ncbi:RIP metalloprotease RseP [Verrucomicrobiota bacterium]
MLTTIAENIFYVLILILFVGVSIFVHEFGHYIMARLCGMVVDVFSIGFGPAIWKKKIKGITYKIGWIPFGGYVALPQLDPTGMAVIQGEDEPQPAADHVVKGEEHKKRELPPVSPWKKILVSLAGATGNVLFAIILAWVIYLSPGVITGESGPLLVDVSTNSAAYHNGLRSGDEIIAVNEEPVVTWNEYVFECYVLSGKANEVVLTIKSNDVERKITVPTEAKDEGFQYVDGVKSMRASSIIVKVESESSAEEAGLKTMDVIKAFRGEEIKSWNHFVGLVKNSPEEEQDITVERMGDILHLRVTPRYSKKLEKNVLGVMQVYDVMPWMQYKRPLPQVKNDAKGIWRFLRALCSRREGEAKKVAGSVMGMPGIVALLWYAVHMSLFNAVGFIRFLNINLAILNLLPIPVLDGGHIVFALWKGITGKDVHPKLSNILVNIFGVLLIGLIILISVRDVLRIFPGISRFFGRNDTAIEQTTTNAVPSVSGGQLIENAPASQRYSDGGCAGPAVNK